MTSSLKPSGAEWIVAEQIVEDPVTELTIQFLVLNGQPRIRLWGANLPFGNREILFEQGGGVVGTGTGICAAPQASWLTPVYRPEERA
jgi:hypothetical protein